MTCWTTTKAKSGRAADSCPGASTIDYINPPRPRNATSREIAILSEATRAAHFTTDPGHARAIEDAVKLIVKLIDDRVKRQIFDEQCDPTHQD